MKDLEIQRLLLDSGFQPAPPPPAARWALIGEYEPEQSPLRVTCALGARGGFVLLVSSERERQWLVKRLAGGGMGAVDVRAERMDADARAAWLAVGMGALALFGWVLSSIHPFFP